MKLVNLRDSIENVEEVFELLYGEWGSYFRKTKDEKIKSVKEAFNRGERFPMFYILKEGSEVVGVFSFEEYEEGGNNSALLRYVLIKEEHRGKGYGRLLLEAIDHVAKENFGKLFLMTDLVGYYEKIGCVFMKNVVRQSGEVNRLYKKEYK